MAEYNIQMNRYVSASDSYDQLFPKTKTVDVVDQNGDNLDTLLADKQDEILISGILKGNGAGGISAAVAGADFAPAGYGLGTSGRSLTATDDLNAISECGFYFWAYDAPQNAPFTYGAMIVTCRVTGINSVCVQEVICLLKVQSEYPNANCKVRRTNYSGTFGAWEWVNPPMATNVVYRTTERRNGNPVYKKMDSNGIVYWSTDQSTWYAEQSSLSITKQELVSSDTTPSINGQINWTYG